MVAITSGSAVAANTRMQSRAISYIFDGATYGSARVAVTFQSQTRLKAAFAVSIRIVHIRSPRAGRRVIRGNCHANDSPGCVVGADRASGMRQRLFARKPPTATPPLEWIDPATGHRVIRLSTEAGTRSMYFHQNSITPDGRYVITEGTAGIVAIEIATRKNDADRAGQGARAVRRPQIRPGVFFAQRRRRRLRATHRNDHLHGAGDAAESRGASRRSSAASSARSTPTKPCCSACMRSAPINWSRVRATRVSTPTTRPPARTASR